MEYSVRPIQPKESEEWLRLRNLLWGADDHATEIAQFFAGDIEEPVEVLIACDTDSHVVVHVELSIRNDIAGLNGIKTGYIGRLYVDVPHRSSGLVRKVLRESEQWARNQGCTAFASDRQDRIIVHKRFQMQRPDVVQSGRLRYRLI
jgi:aminoglycoside 6'-N-acetyltransferase I